MYILLSSFISSLPASRGYDTRSGNILSFLLPLFQEGQLSVTGESGGGRVVRRCWVNFQCQGVLLTWLTVGQGVVGWCNGAG